MSSFTLDVNTVQLISKFTELGIKYFESRQKRKVNLAEAGIVDSVDEALGEFEGLNVPEAYAIPDDEPLLVPPKHASEDDESDNSSDVHGMISSLPRPD